MRPKKYTLEEYKTAAEILTSVFPQIILDQRSKRVLGSLVSTHYEKVRGEKPKQGYRKCGDGKYSNRVRVYHVFSDWDLVYDVISKFVNANPNPEYS